MSIRRIPSEGVFPNSLKLDNNVVVLTKSLKSECRKATDQSPFAKINPCLALLLKASAETLVKAMHENVIHTDIAIQGVPRLFVLRKILGALPSRAML